MELQREDEGEKATWKRKMGDKKLAAIWKEVREVFCGVSSFILHVTKRKLQCC